MTHPTARASLPVHMKSAALNGAMILMAVLSVGLATADLKRHGAWPWIESLSLFVVAVSFKRWLCSKARPSSASPPFRFVIGAALVTALPFILALVGPRFGYQEQPLELILLSACRNLSLALLALSGWEAYGRLGGILSLFLVLFSTTLAESKWALVIIVVYAALGCLWLMRLHWHSDNQSRSPARFPLVPAMMVLVVVAIAIAAAASGTDRIASALHGYVPSSGGTNHGSDFARGGIGDGPDEIANGKDPKTIGYDQSDIFVNSDKSSLYDSFAETYGEPVKTDEFKKMIFLHRKDIQPSDKTAVADFRAGRSFSVVRQPPKALSVQQERAAGALFYVKGETPLHLPLKAYDHFDGVNWIESKSGQLGRTITKDAASTWMSVNWQSVSDAFAGEQEHQIRIGTLDSDVLPLPSHLTRFRMGRVDKPDFFIWEAAGILKLAKRTAPSGTVIATVCRTADPSLLRHCRFDPPSKSASLFVEPVTFDTRVAALAREWVGAVPHGWKQVESVTEHLRSQAILDRNSGSMPTEDSPIAHFLFSTRRGPDYLFASSAVAMLRSLGYPTRLVSGYYADPGRYDPASEQTPITSLDAHFWAEVRLSDGCWIAIEPTPGYRIAEPHLSWWKRAATSTAEWIRRRVVELVLIFMVVCSLVYFRLRVADLVITAAWYLGMLRKNNARLAISTLRLIDRRFRLAGRPRPLGRTPRHWFTSADAAVPRAYTQPLSELASLANHAFYSSADGRRTPVHAQVVCRRLGLELTAARLKASPRYAAQGGMH